MKYVLMLNYLFFFNNHSLSLFIVTSNRQDIISRWKFS